MSNEPGDLSRRRFLELTAATAAVVAAGGLLPRSARAAALPHLTPANPQAKALGFVENTAQVDQAKYPSHKTSQDCSNCTFFQGAAGAPWGPCAIFRGFAVPAKGWCSAHATRK